MTNTTLPQTEDFYINTSLYTEYEITDDDRDAVFELVFTQKTIDCYCIDCNTHSVFKPVENRPNKTSHGQFYFPITGQKDWQFTLVSDIDVFEKEFHCSRNVDHLLSFFLQIKLGKIQKIGQYPALTEIAEQEIKKFKKILGNDYYQEFSKAIGLYTHGIGVGAFVYLRRIIENFIIIPTYQTAKLKPDWDEDKYQKSRVKEKINLLKTDLPQFLVENPVLYSIVSKGIHELTEDECKKYFPILKTCIEFLLTDLEAKRTTELKRKEMQEKLGKISGELN